MKDNPFASFAAGAIKNNDGGGSSGGGWMTTRKVGRDDSAIKQSKAAAEEARRAKNRRGGAAKKQKGKQGGGGGGGGAKKRRSARRKNDFINDSDEESFVAYSEDEDLEDDFIVRSDDDDGGGGSESGDEDEGDWDSGMEDDDSDYGGKKKKKNKKKTADKGRKATALSRSARASRRTNQKSTWKPPSSQNSLEDDEIEESPVPPSRGRRKKKKAVVESPISLDSDEEMSDVDKSTESMDDIYASSGNGKGKKKEAKTITLESDSESSSSSTDLSPSPFVGKKKKTSKYFNKSTEDNSSFGEEKKEEDENLLNGARFKSRSNANKKRRIMEDSDSEDDIFGAKSKGGANSQSSSKASVTVNLSDGDLSDTPTKSARVSKPTTLSSDDFVNDEEAVAIQAAMAASLDDGTKEHKRLKKKQKKKNKGKSRSKGGGGSISSSLEDIKQASPAKESKVQYKDDIEELKDSDDDDDDNMEDDEIEVYEVDEEEQTAAQVLAEANALSAKIIKIVSGWCGAGGSDGNTTGKVKGLILGENDGALNLGSGGVSEETKAKDEMWISDETMKEIMPNVTLAEYQLLGVNWMAMLNRTKFGKGSGKKGKKGGLNVNGILADEMGLGKTVQTIAFLSWLNKQKKSSSEQEDGDDEISDKQRPHLIVVPASVLSNWMKEFKKFAPDMIVMKYHGTQAEREIIREEMEMNFVHGNEPLDAVLTTFSYFSSDSNKGDRSFLRKFKFDYLVVDEGHTLKNPKGLRYQNLNKFQTSHRLLLTGTPVQNSPKELMSLLCFLMPLFDSKTKSSSKSKKGYSNDSDDENDGGERMLEYFVHLEGGSGDDAQAYRKLKQLFAPFVLRRKKEDVLGQILPPKTRQVDLVPMDEATRSAYDGIISSHVQARAKKDSGATDATAQKHLFTALRKAANHPLLLRNRFKTEEEKDKLARLAMNYGWFGSDPSCTLQLVRDELDKYSDYEVHCAAHHMIEENPPRREYLEKYTLMENDLFCSPKFVRLRSLLPDLIGKGHRILIFSQWTKVLDLMGHLLNSLDLSNHLRLDGQTAVSERQDLIDKFNKDSSIAVFLLSTRAGGMGLNLTSADVCILHDLDFNPFNDSQAEDRCHRIGQKKPVTIIKMVTEGTVDEDIYRIQERKARMNEAIMEEGGNKRNGKASDAKEMCRLANAAVERFLKSPTKPAKNPVINIDD